MTKVGQSVNFLNKDGQLIVDMKQYSDLKHNIGDGQFSFPSSYSLYESKFNSTNLNDAGIRSKMEEKRKSVISIKSKFQQNKINELRIKKQKLMEKQLHGSAYDDDQEKSDEEEDKQNEGQNQAQNQNLTNTNNNSMLFMDDDLEEFDGLILVCNVVCASLRNCRKVSNRLIALEIINGFAEYLNDEIRLDRLVPWIRSLIHDDKKKFMKNIVCGCKSN